MKRFLKEAIPMDLENNYRAALSGAMRKIIIEGDETFGVTPPAALRDRYDVFDKEVVRGFIKKNMDGVGREAWNRQCQRARKAMEGKVKNRGI